MPGFRARSRCKKQLKQRHEIQPLNHPPNPVSSMKPDNAPDTHTLSIRSRLPEAGTTIFTTMSALAAQHGAINLGQGFPDFPCDPALVDCVTSAMKNGDNQYPPMTGVPVLRESVAAMVRGLYGYAYDPDSEITITAGATQAILTAILAVVHPGDEVIVIEPAYDSYVPAIQLAGGTPLFVQMAVTQSGFNVPWDKVAAAVSARTRMIIVNSPHNPTGSILRKDDIAALSDIVAGTDILILSDEVYEHMVFDGQRHESITRHPALASRAFVVSSFGKTFHVTGWKIGYVAAPAALTVEFRKVHQFNVFTVNTPVQLGIAAYLAEPSPYRQLASFYQRKRDLFREGLRHTRFRMLPSDGTYFQCVDCSGITPMSELEFARWLTTEIGVAAIPTSAFYHQEVNAGVVRFCFAKKDETLHEALHRLKAL
jgi:methionine aminotransferase